MSHPVYPKKYREEGKKLTELFLDADESVSFDDIVEMYATSEYKEYHYSELKRIKEEQTQGILSA